MQMSRVDMALEHNRAHSFFTGVGWPTDKREWPNPRALAQAGYARWLRPGRLRPGTRAGSGWVRALAQAGYARWLSQASIGWHCGTTSVGASLHPLARARWRPSFVGRRAQRCDAHCTRRQSAACRTACARCALQLLPLAHAGRRAPLHHFLLRCAAHTRLEMRSFPAVWRQTNSERLRPLAAENQLSVSLLLLRPWQALCCRRCRLCRRGPTGMPAHGVRTRLQPRPQEVTAGPHRPTRTHTSARTHARRCMHAYARAHTARTRDAPPTIRIGARTAPRLGPSPLAAACSQPTNGSSPRLHVEPSFATLCCLARADAGCAYVSCCCALGEMAPDELLMEDAHTVAVAPNTQQNDILRLVGHDSGARQ
jgi:hypothetical protein